MARHRAARARTILDEVPAVGSDARRASASPEPLPPTPTCPNDHWIPHIVDVSFTTATLTLFEDDVQVDQVTVPVSSG
jgi:hypothetical protein